MIAVAFLAALALLALGAAAALVADGRHQAREAARLGRIAETLQQHRVDRQRLP